MSSQNQFSQTNSNLSFAEFILMASKVECNTPREMHQGIPPTDPSTYTQPAYTTQTSYVQPKPFQPVGVAPASQQPAKEAMEADNISLSSEKDDEGSSTGGEGKGKKVFGHKSWYQRKNFNMRVSKKIRKRRQNAKLRQLLTPKNAMMVLHELHPELKIVATEQLNAANQMVYSVDIEIDGKIFKGHGMSKLAAKQAGCECALKAVLLNKISKSQAPAPRTEEVVIKKEPSEPEVESTTSTSTTDQPMKVEAPENPEEHEPVKKEKKHDEDEVPWVSVACFAMYKLFSDWQAQGFQLPPTSASALPIFPRHGSALNLTGTKKIPEDASKKHPVQLLNQLRPGSQYSETREGVPPNLTFTFSVNVDGQTYTGTGTSKKDAKKECAKAALLAMGVVYD